MTFWARILRGQMTCILRWLWTCGAEHEEEESEKFDKKDEENEDECNKSKVKRKYEIDNDDCVDVTDEEYETEVNEFNVWYSKKLKERRHLKVDDKRSNEFYRTECVEDKDDMNDEM